MSNIKPMTLRAIADMVGGTIEGDETVSIAAVGAIDSAGPGEITFAVDEKRMALLKDSEAAAAIVGSGEVQTSIPLIRVDNVIMAIGALLATLAGEEDVPPVGIHPSAVVAPDASVDDDVAIGPGVVIGSRAKIGSGCKLCANVVIGAGVELGQDVVLSAGVVILAGCVIGDRVRIFANSVVGSDGFGYFTHEGVHHKIPHIGNVIISDDVELGACVCVDRAKFGATRIGAGSKIDNLVQIAHSVQIGRGCLIASSCGIAGSVRMGDYVVLGGHVGVRDNVTIGNGVQCAAYAAIARNIPDGQAIGGIPAIPARQFLRVVKANAKLPELRKRVRTLESRLEALESSKDN